MDPFYYNPPGSYGRIIFGGRGTSEKGISSGYPASKGKIKFYDNPILRNRGRLAISYAGYLALSLQFFSQHF